MLSTTKGNTAVTPANAGAHNPCIFNMITDI
jgi:hypothetical protein